MIQGQGSRVSRSPTGNNLNLKTDSRARDSGAVHSTNARFVKFGGVESILNDRGPVVPSDELDLSQDDEMGPWLSYPIQDALGQDNVSEILPEISGVTGNGMSTRNSFVSVGKRSSCDQSVGTALKISSSKDGPLGSWLPQNRQGSDTFGSGGSDIVSRNTSNHQDATFGNPAQGRDVVNGTGSVKIGSQNIRSNVLNFSHFSRPANIFKVNLPNSDGNPASGSSGVGRMEGREKGPVDSTVIEKLKSIPNVHGSSTTIPVVNPGEPPASIPKGASLLERAEYLCQGTSGKNDKPLSVSNTDNSTKGVPDGERIVDSLAASSSVGSGNSADRVSYEQTHNSKRKFRDNEESECRSDGVDTESLDVKKPNSLRGSKRSRAAEVHNLSERRRRDRINEKMRTLQELIPNCNKADKASMLDEAIEYLKTLQLQVQIMSIGAGLCMPPMIPTGMLHVHPAHVPHFPPMGVGMGVNVGVGVGIGMGFGMGMLDMYGGSSGRAVFPVPTVQAPSIAPPGSVMANFQKIPGPNLPFFGHPGQGLPNVVPSAPFVSLSTAPPATSALGLSATTSRNQCNSEVPSTSPIINPRDLVTAMSSQSILCNAETSCSADDKSNQLQAKSEVLDKSASVQENKMGTDVMGLGTRTSTTTSDISKEPGENNKSPHGLHAYSTRDGNSGFA